MINNFLLNKKGDLSINLLVMMVLLICVSNVFLFATSNTRVEKIIAGTGLEITSVYEKQTVEFYASESAEDALIESYYDLVAANGYIGNPIANPLEPEFDVVSQGIDERISEEVYQNMKDNFLAAGQPYDKVYFQFLREAVLNESKFKDSLINSDSNGISFYLSGINLSTSGADSNVDYNARIPVNIAFSEVGLNSFQEIGNARSSCIIGDNATKIGECFNAKLKNFYSSAEKKKVNDKDKWLISLESKRHYIIDGVLRNIQIKFLV